MHRISKDQRTYYVGPDVEPVLEVDSGDTVVFETVDCFSEKVASPQDKFSSYAQSLEVLPGWNPVTGPVYVRGSRPGDCLAVEIVDIKLPPSGATSYVPGLGMLASGFQMAPDLEAETRICRIADGLVHLPTSRGEVAIPAAPMVGTISVAPARETIASFKFGSEHCGNVDCREIAPGNTLLLPVNTPGALFGLGDVHAVQGDGEITCVAVEVSAEVTVRLSLIPREQSPYLACPQVNGPDFIGSIGCHFGNSIENNIKYAYHDLIQRLHQAHGFSPMDAYHLLSQAGRVRVCQVLGDFQAAMASVERRFLQ